MQMFTPTQKPEPQKPEPGVVPATPKSSNGAAEQTNAGGVLSSGVSIKGTVKFSGELIIDGDVEGSIESTGRLTVGKNGHIEGEVRTGSVAVYGTVDGNITSVERCELHSGCTLRGDIEAPRLVVDEEATFLGSARISTRPKAQE